MTAINPNLTGQARPESFVGQTARPGAPRGRSLPIVLVAGLAVLFGCAIPAIAAARTGPVIYYACVATRGGAIKIVSARTICAAHQRKISWNKAGPQGRIGPQGPTGQQGPAGPQGPPGVVAGYQASQSGPISLSSTDFTTVAQLTLPVTGNFLVTARAEADSIGGPTADSVRCSLTDSNNVAIDTSLVTLTGSDPLAANIDNIMVTAFTKSGGLMGVQCIDFTGQGAIGTYVPTVMTAIPVATVVAEAPAHGNGALHDVLPRRRPTQAPER